MLGRYSRCRFKIEELKIAAGRANLLVASCTVRVSLLYCHLILGRPCLFFFTLRGRRTLRHWIVSEICRRRSVVLSTHPNFSQSRRHMGGDGGHETGLPVAGIRSSHWLSGCGWPPLRGKERRDPVDAACSQVRQVLTSGRNSRCLLRAFQTRLAVFFFESSLSDRWPYCLQTI